MKYWLGCISVLISFSLFATESFPKNCKVFAFKGENLVIKAPKPKVILINNQTEATLFLSHTGNTGLTTKIDAAKWASLVVHQKKFIIQCIESKPGHEQQVPCEGMLTTCQLSKVKIPQSRDKTFWAAENLDRKALENHLAESGFKW